jgi:hypothetical protein
MLSTTRQKPSRSVLVGALNAVQSSSYSSPILPAHSKIAACAHSTARTKEERKLEKLAYRATKKTIDQIARAPRAGSTKKLSRGLKEKNEIRDAILGAIAARPSFRSENSTVFSTTEARPEDLEAPGDGEGFDLIPELHVEPGSFVELRRCVNIHCMQQADANCKI